MKSLVQPPRAPPRRRRRWMVRKDWRTSRGLEIKPATLSSFVVRRMTFTPYRGMVALRPPCGLANPSGFPLHARPRPSRSLKGSRLSQKSGRTSSRYSATLCLIFSLSSSMTPSRARAASCSCNSARWRVPQSVKVFRSDDGGIPAETARTSLDVFGDGPLELSLVHHFGDVPSIAPRLPPRVKFSGSATAPPACVRAQIVSRRDAAA